MNVRTQINVSPRSVVSFEGPNLILRTDDGQELKLLDWRDDLFQKFSERLSLLDDVIREIIQAKCGDAGKAADTSHT